MKKIIIALLLVLSVGAFALTIPKKASAHTIDITNEPTMSEILNMKPNDSIKVYHDLGQIVEGPDLSYVIESVSYDYLLLSNETYAITNLSYELYIYQTGSKSRGVDCTITDTYIYQTGLTTGRNSFESYSYNYYLKSSFILYGLEGADNWYEVEVEMDTKFANPSDENENVVYSYCELLFYGTPLEQGFDVPRYEIETCPYLLLYAKLLGEDYIIKDFPTYIDGNTDFTDFLETSTSGFLDTEIIGTLSIGEILLFVVSIGLTIFIIKMFGGS